LASNGARCSNAAEIIKKLETIKWWDWDEKTIKNNIEFFYDIKKFINRFNVD
jgi:hypothetical protein